MLVRMQGVAGCWLWGSCDPVNTTDVFSIRICGLKKKNNELSLSGVLKLREKQSVAN